MICAYYGELKVTEGLATMGVNQAQNGVILTFAGGTVLTTPRDTPLTAQSARALTPISGTARRYKPRARKCKCGCGQTFTPTAKNPNKKFFDDNCRKRWHRHQEAKLRKQQPASPPVETLLECAYCHNTFFGVAHRGAKYCKPSHKVLAANSRREGAIQVFIELGYEPDDARKWVTEELGMKAATSLLRHRGYRYDNESRQWKLHRAKSLVG